MLVYDLNQMTGPSYIINFPTKQHWKNQSQLEDIEAALRDLVETVRKLRIQRIAIPALGCGLGELNWSDVRPRIESAFQEVPELQVAIFEPSGVPDAPRIVRQPKVPEVRKQQLTFRGA